MTPRLGLAVTIVWALVQLRDVDAFSVVSNVPLVSRSSTTSLSAESKVFMPALSSTMKEGKVVSWLKSEGDPIESGEAIMVVESDKADMDVEAFEDGYLAKILVDEGDMAPVGDAVALIAETEDEIPAVIAAAGDGSGTSATTAAPPAADASSGGGFSC